MYEVPTEIKRIYRHWKSHTNSDLPTYQSVSLHGETLKEIGKFIKSRMDIWNAKILHKKMDSDLIFTKYRFCNIYRELDRQTIEIHTDLAELRENFSLWLLNVAFYRFVCKTETVRNVGLLSFERKNNKKVFDRLIKHPRPKYGTAYVFPISVIQKSNFPTREEFFCFYLPEVIPQIAGFLEKQKNTSVDELLPKIKKLFGFTFNFHWTEILIDVAYQYPEIIDLYKEFPVGPGSIPTMKLLNKNEPPEKTLLSLLKETPENFPYLTINRSPILLSAENWEGIGCEFRKYKNLQKGVGRKRLYKN